MEVLRIWAIIVLISLSVIDLAATHYYVKRYKEWQPNKPYKLMERNKLFVFLWNSLGFELGTAVSSIITLSLIYIIGRFAGSIIIGLLFGLLVFALFNHNKNIKLLNKLEGGIK